MQLATFHWGEYQTRMVMLAALGVVFAVSLQLINGVSGQFSLGHAGFVAIGAYLSGYASLTYAALDAGSDPPRNFENPGQVCWYFISLGMIAAAVSVVIFVLFLVFRFSRRIAHWLPPLLLLGALAWFTWDFKAGFELEVAPEHLIWTHLIRGLSRWFDWTLSHGLPHADSFSHWLPPVLRRPLCMIILLCGGGFFAAMAGLLVGLPTLRLRGDYLAIVTLGFAEILRVIFSNSVALGRTTGLSIIPYTNAGDERDNDPVRHYIFPWILGLMVLTVIAVWRIAYSPKGRLIRAVPRG